MPWPPFVHFAHPWPPFVHFAHPCCMYLFAPQPCENILQARMPGPCHITGPHNPIRTIRPTILTINWTNMSCYGLPYWSVHLHMCALNSLRYWPVQLYSNAEKTRFTLLPFPVAYACLQWPTILTCPSVHVLNAAPYLHALIHILNAVSYWPCPHVLDDAPYYRPVTRKVSLHNKVQGWVGGWGQWGLYMGCMEITASAQLTLNRHSVLIVRCWSTKFQVWRFSTWETWLYILLQEDLYITNPPVSQYYLCVYFSLFR